MATRPDPQILQPGASQCPIPVCGICRLAHYGQVRCPSITTEIQLRLAIDGVRALSNGHEVAINYNRALLQNMLRGLKHRSVVAPPAMQWQKAQAQMGATGTGGLDQVSQQHQKTQQEQPPSAKR